MARDRVEEALHQPDQERQLDRRVDEDQPEVAVAQPELAGEPVDRDHRRRDRHRLEQQHGVRDPVLAAELEARQRVARRGPPRRRRGASSRPRRTRCWRGRRAKSCSVKIRTKLMIVGSTGSWMYALALRVERGAGAATGTGRGRTRRPRGRRAWTSDPLERARAWPSAGGGGPSVAGGRLVGEHSRAAVAAVMRAPSTSAGTRPRRRG